MHLETKIKQKVHLNLTQTLTHYGIVFFILIPLIIAIFVHLKKLIESEVPAQWSEFEWSYFISLIPAVIFYFIQKKKLEFQSHPYRVSSEVFDETILRYIDKINLSVDLNNSGKFQAKRPWDWSGSWGEMISIEHQEDQILINSICDPDKESSVISYGMNKSNIRTFFEILNDVINNIPVKKEEEILLKEWTLGKTLNRILMYSLCLILILICSLVLYFAFSIVSLVLCGVVIVLAGVYIWADLKIILTRKDKRTSSL